MIKQSFLSNESEAHEGVSTIVGDLLFEPKLIGNYLSSTPHFNRPDRPTSRFGRLDDLGDINL
jgi:hypothetical protein